ncbi:hypothetical protein [Dactylosporangium sp. CA-139066]
MRIIRGELTRVGGLRADAYQIQVDTRDVDPNVAERRLAWYWPM